MLYSSAKSVPNWLDRLRSNKGFPAADNNLEHFLLTSSSSDSPNCPNHTELSSSLVVVSQQNRRRPEKISELMSNAISELFFIDGSDESSRLSNSKLPRKQTHPKVHVSLRSSRSRSRRRSRLGNDVNALDKVGGDDEAEEERGGGGGEREMKGYSKSEVTVIDTSCEVWKTEKVLFRRKSVWKVREKRAKVRSFGRNKRKCDDDDDGDKNMEKKKKNKEEAKDVDVDVDEDQCTSIQHIEGQNSQNDARKEVCEVSTDNPNERGKEFSREDVPDNNRKHIKKGFSLNRLPRKTVKDGLSVVFIKGIPTDEKIEGKLPKKFVKDSQRKYKT